MPVEDEESQGCSAGVQASPVGLSAVLGMEPYGSVQCWGSTEPKHQHCNRRPTPNPSAVLSAVSVQLQMPTVQEQGEHGRGDTQMQQG
eukprot:359258-Chlamydomonas_euryale.AAC.25